MRLHRIFCIADMPVTGVIPSSEATKGSLSGQCSSTAFGHDVFPRLLINLRLGDAEWRQLDVLVDLVEREVSRWTRQSDRSVPGDFISLPRAGAVSEMRHNAPTILVDDQVCAERRRLAVLV